MDKDILLAVYFGSQPPEYATDRELQRAKDYLNADLAAEAGPDLPGVSDLIHFCFKGTVVNIPEGYVTVTSTFVTTAIALRASSFKNSNLQSFGGNLVSRNGIYIIQIVQTSMYRMTAFLYRS